MNILFVTHASFEKPGSIQTWAEKNGHKTQMVKPYEGETLPEVDPYDLLVVMGGPQSPLKIEKYPYLKDEINFLAEGIKQNKKIIGVCLGAQLIAEAVGAKTERSPNREIGMYPLQMLEAAKSDPVFSKFGDEVEVMHWHSDMPGIPEGAELLAKSSGCPKQIYRYGDRIYGFQCHFELTKECVSEMLEPCADDLKPAQYVMSKDELMNVNYDVINEKMDTVLDYLSNLD